MHTPGGSVRGDLLVAAGATGVLGATSVAARRAPGYVEKRLFTVVNRMSEMKVLRLPQQFGTPWALPATAMVLALRGRRREALAAAICLPAEKFLEVRIKKLWHRPRPVLVTPTILRDDAPVEGPSFPSGHAAIGAASAYFQAREFPPAKVPLSLVVATTSAVRVHQGAHWPADLAGGAALGVAVAATLRAAVRR